MEPELLEGASALPFTAAEHVASINSLPTTFGQLNADGMFPAEGLDTIYIKIEIKDGVLRALPITPDGRPSTIARHEKGEYVILEIPNVSHEDSVLAADLRKMLAMARRSRDPDNTLAAEVEKRHRRNRLKFDMTLEVMKMGALKGVITDGDNTVLYDLYDIFDLTQKVFYFDLDNANADPVSKMEELIASLEDDLTDETMSGIDIRVSPEFYNKFLGHAKFQKYFLGTPDAQYLLSQQRSQRGGAFGRRLDTKLGVNLVEYRQKFTPWSGGAAQRLIAAGEGYAYATGTNDTEKTWVAPPIHMDELDGVGDTADLIYMSEPERMKHGRGEEWAYQMNALPVWARPKLTAKVTAAAAP